MRVLVLSHDDVVQSLLPRACADAVAEVLAARAREETYMPLRSVMVPPRAHGVMALMPSWRGSADGGMFALKAICVIPDNPSRGLDSHQGTVTLFDGRRGVPLAILDASALTALRTAAVSAVATSALAREDAEVLAVLGAGVQAEAHLRALAGIRPLRVARVYAPTLAHAQALLERVSEPEPPPFELELASSAEEAIRGADVVVTATSSPRPVLERSWLAAGTHVNAIGASTPTEYELDLATVAAAALFCDSRESLEHEAGEFRLAVREGLIDERDHVRAELGEVLAGLRPGRRDSAEITVFRSLGLAVEDLAAAQQAVGHARSSGIGTEVEL